MNSWRQTMMAGAAPDARRGAGLRDHRLPARPAELRPCRRWSSTAPPTRPCRSTPPAAVAKEVPDAKLIEYDGSAHGLFATDKERLIDDLPASSAADCDRPAACAIRLQSEGGLT